MKLKKIIALAALTCCLSVPLASAEVVPVQQKDIGRALTLPQVQLEKSSAAKNAKAAVQQTVDSFKMMHAGMERVKIDYEVVCDTDEYVSLLLHGLASNDGMPRPGKEAHALVISKKTGKAMELKEFIKVPKLAVLKQKVERGECRLMFIDRQQELNAEPVKSLKLMPTEFIVDEAACVYLLLTEQARYVTDTPLLRLDVDSCQELYLVKG